MIKLFKKLCVVQGKYEETSRQTSFFEFDCVKSEMEVQSCHEDEDDVSEDKENNNDKEIIKSSSLPDNCILESESHHLRLGFK